VLRDATPEDAPAINRLYNALIDTTTVAWTEQPEPLDARRAWLEEQTRAGRPVLVAEDEAEGAVVGFASYSDFRGAGKWPGYRFTVEHTVHVDGAQQGRRIGTALMEALMARAAAAGLHVMIGAVDSDNLTSIRFHERLGFIEVARLPEVGFKFDRWLTLVLLQRVL
jgi:L-amino acid N-acyltransferase YncA